MQIWSHTQSHMVAVELQPGPVLPASVHSSAAEISQQLAFILAKKRSVDKGADRAQLHMIGSLP